jgi:hypothetical protein
MELEPLETNVSQLAVLKEQNKSIIQVKDFIDLTW